MEENPITRKMHIKNARTILFLNLPEGYFEKLSPVPAEAHLSQTASGKSDADFVLLFVHNNSELEQLGPAAFSSVKLDKLLWVAYPKISSKVKTDITRDKGWEPAHKFGLEGVAMVAIDETWSAMRLKFTGGGKIRQGGQAKAAVKEDRTVEIPIDLKALLEKNRLLEQFEKTSYTNRKEYVHWIETAKKAETRQSRLQKAVERIGRGERFS